MEHPHTDSLVVGRTLRHYRQEAGYTLDELATELGVTSSLLSLIENGKRDPKLSLLSAAAATLHIGLEDLLSANAPTERAQREIAVEQAQRDERFERLNIPHVKITSRTPDDVLDAIGGLYSELRRQETQRQSTPEMAREANVRMREIMRGRENYFGELETHAQSLLDAIGHTSGPLTHNSVGALAEYLGFDIRYAATLPHATRSVTDLKNKRFYLSDVRGPGHETRSVLLQAIAAYTLGHGVPKDYFDFLQMRMHANYVAGALLMPEKTVARDLKDAQKRRDIAIEDLRDGFGVSYEAAAHRFTNVATHHLGIHCHFQKVHESGVIHKAYENDDVDFPRDSIGAIEGQTVCRYWTSREVFDHGNRNRFRGFNQYTDTQRGTFWCTAIIEPGANGNYSLSIGVPFADARNFRGSDTTERSVSRCPDPSCCRVPSPELDGRWRGQVWPAVRMHTSLLAAMPTGVFPGVDEVEVLEFLQAQTE